MDNKLFLNIAGYKFESLDNLDKLIPTFQKKCDELDLRASIYLSPNGINLSIAGTEQDIDTYITFMEQDERFLNIPLKRTYSNIGKHFTCTKEETSVNSSTRT